MTGRIGGFVEIDHTRANIRLQVPLQWGTTIGNWCEMAGSDEHCISRSAIILAIADLCAHTVVVVLE